MNLHFPQTYNTKAEVHELMMVSKNIVSGQSNRPVIGIVQDALLASRILTSRDTFLTKKEMMNLMLKLDHKIQHKSDNNGKFNKTRHFEKKYVDNIDKI